VSERAVVFVVDDDPSMRRSLESLLRSVGLDARLFSSAQEFMQAPRPDAPGCLVLDVRLPGMSGLTSQQELASAGVALPVIFITGYGDVPMTVRAMKAGGGRVPYQPVRRSGVALQREVYFFAGARVTARVQRVPAGPVPPQ
jgi:FixJ family two-component response regulator